MSAGTNRVLSSPIEQSVQARGPTPQAVWLDRDNPLEKGVRRCDAIFRMIEAFPDCTILDLGCGLGLALGYLEERYGSMLGRYCGIDVSQFLIEHARKLWPGHSFVVQDIVADPLRERSFDVVAINGVLTAKWALAQSEMESFAKRLLAEAWRSTAIALSFNVMSPHVDWRRDHLFHWPIDAAVNFCVAALSRHVNVITDYGLYEYTVQVFREPRPASRIPAKWSEAPG